MSRHDTGLYTGITSSSFTKQQEVRKERLSERRQKREQLLPAGEIVNHTINLEVKSLRDLTTINVMDLSAEDLKTEARGRELAIQHLTRVQVRLNNLLREMKEPNPKAKPGGLENDFAAAAE